MLLITYMRTSFRIPRACTELSMERLWGRNPKKKAPQRNSTMENNNVMIKGLT